MYVARFSLSRGFGSSFVPSQRRGRSHVYIERGLNGDIIRSQHLHALPAPQYKRGRERKGNSAVQCSSWLGPLFFPNILDKNTSLLLVRVFQPPLTQREMPSWNPRVWKGKSSFFPLFFVCLPALYYIIADALCIMTPFEFEPTPELNGSRTELVWFLNVYL